MPAASLTDSRLVVTGGTGFLGSAFVRHAATHGATVTVLARPSASAWRLADASGDRVTMVPAALADLPAMSLPSARAGVFVHFAAAGVNQNFDDVPELVSTNVLGTAEALLFSLHNGIERFVLVGSSGEYGPGNRLSEAAALRPTSEYGATRAAATLLARAFAERRGLDVVVVRPFAVYGPFEPAYRLIPYAVMRGLRGEPIRISSGSQTRDYVHVDDVAAGIARACLVPGAAGGIYNLCSGVETSVREAATLIAELTGGRSAVDVGARADIPGEMWRTSGDPSRARETLDWQPQLPLRGGLTQTVEWFRRVGCSLPAYQERPA